MVLLKFVLYIFLSVAFGFFLVYMWNFALFVFGAFAAMGFAILNNKLNYIIKHLDTEEHKEQAKHLDEELENLE